jgi:hypothetical protein
MKRELELYLRNERVINQNCFTERNPRRFMRDGVWVTQYTVHINTYISGLSLRVLIEAYEDGVVETKLVYSTYGDYHISYEDYKRREKHIAHISKYGATYKEEPPIRWFN